MLGGSLNYLSSCQQTHLYNIVGIFNIKNLWIQVLQYVY